MRPVIASSMLKSQVGNSLRKSSTLYRILLLGLNDCDHVFKDYSDRVHKSINFDIYDIEIAF